MGEGGYSGRQNGMRARHRQERQEGCSRDMPVQEKRVQLEQV